MKLERIKLTNFLSHADTDLDLSKVSLLAIVGENGAGKSSLFDAFIWCLYGKVNTRGGQSDSISRYGSDQTSVTVVWILNDIKYQLTRTLDSKKKSQKLELSVNDQIISDRKKTEVEALVLDILKIPADLYCLTNAMQQESASFLSLKPTERKAFLSKILQLDKYKQVQIQAKTSKSKLVNGKANLEGQFKIIDEEISKYTSIIAQDPILKESLEDIEPNHQKVLSFLSRAAEEKIEEKQKEITRRNEFEAAISLYEKKLFEIKDTPSQLEEIELQITNLEKDKKSFESEYNSFWCQEEKLVEKSNKIESDKARKIGQISADINTCKKEYIKLQEIIDKAQIIDTSMPCPTCYQDVCEEHVQKITEIYKKQQNDHTALGKELVASKKKSEADFDLLKEEVSKESEVAKAEKVKYKELLTQLEASLAHSKGQRNEVSFRLAEKAKLEAEILSCQEKLKNLSIEVVSLEIIEKIKKAEELDKKYKAEKREIENQINHISFIRTKQTELVEKKEFIIAQIKELDRNIEIYNLIIDACHPQKGIPAKIIENSLTPLEKISNDILETFPGSVKFNIYFKTLTEDGKETLQLMVRNSNSTSEKYYEQHSGGERLRIDLALRIALIRMIGSIYGVESRTLIIDEGFHSLSSDIRGAAFELLARLHGVWFDRILVVTHSNEISDCVPFKLELKKDKDKTVIGYKNF